MPPPELMEKLVEEALLRVPPDEPAHLVCAALACKPWGELISSHRFHHRFREFHGAPPVLSIIHHNRSDTLFKPTSSLYPPYAIDRAECHALDARHGRVLFCGLDLIVMDLIVMNLITGEEQKLPKPQLPQPPLTWAAALLCTAPGCNHLDCPSGSPFTVVAVATDISLEFTSATFYSSKIVYFILVQLHGNNRILEYDLGTRELTPINIPSLALKIDLITLEDGGLGFIYVQDLKLYLWSRVVGSNKWLQHRVLDLRSLLPVRALSNSPTVVAVADDANVIFIDTSHDNGVFAINLKLGQGTKIGVLDTTLGIVPYESFYTPGSCSHVGEEELSAAGMP
ncbi:hypothetical protein PR202_gb12079 [Eleusine coracana subsp. coracana]|uniref:F-box domain-containing protein n=1 Tax=Eleusine coracana subsp. coracana TaxID=191504 RepID=A0AAV5EPF9_ELECO|nr:hypothetical protein PR202_gb12079 [Eleusine coracana subsp. coracana]